jgi:peptidoglycan/LPS O-acetylase OafA/YrhL
MLLTTSIQYNLLMKFGHMPGLDGLRGVFVLAVVCFHVGVPFMGGGFLGVDGFFTLSGFLITSLLLNEYRTVGHISLSKFYFRRACRLLPAAIAMLAIVGTFIFLNNPSPASVAGNTLGIWSALLYVSNWAGIPAGPGSLTNLGAFNHMWSLSIEEQFYILWPLGLGLLLRYWKQHIHLAVISLIAISVAIRIGLYLSQGELARWRINGGTDTRADGLLIGCLLAVLISFGTLRFPVWATRLGAILSIGIFAALCAFGDFSTVFGHSAGVALTALSVAVMILHLHVSPQGSFSRLLSARPLAGVGVVSYGVYLWHFPICVLVPATSWADWPMQLIRAAFIILAVTFSYRYVEQPFMRLKNRSRVGSFSAMLSTSAIHAEQATTGASRAASELGPIPPAPPVQAV